MQMSDTRGETGRRVLCQQWEKLGPTARQFAFYSMAMAAAAYTDGFDGVGKS